MILFGHLPFDIHFQNKDDGASKSFTLSTVFQSIQVSCGTVKNFSQIHNPLGSHHLASSYL